MLLLGDAVLQPGEAGPELAVEAADGLQHADLPGVAELPRALGVGAPEQADEAGLVAGAFLFGVPYSRMNPGMLLRVKLPAGSESSPHHMRAVSTITSSRAD